MMERALTEAKIRAKRLLKQCNSDNPNALARLARWHRTLQGAEHGLQLKHCQSVIARELGFTDWQQLQRVLSGKATEQDDTPNMGSLFYRDACSAFVNRWFAGYPEARAALDEAHYLLPYKTQFVVVAADYIAALGIDDPGQLQAVNRDLYASYPGPEWDTLAEVAIKSRRV